MITNSRIVITDPHGCLKTLLALIAKLPAGVPITFAGDLVDRGPNSMGVIDFVKDGGYDCTRGNHEQMMIDELRFRNTTHGERPYSDTYHGIWEMNGGDKALESYRYEVEEEMANGEKIKVRPYNIAKLKDHLEWVKNLPYFKEYPEIKNAKGQHLLVSHTTAAHVWDDFAPDHPQFQQGIIWDRDNYPPKIEDRYNIYGHTPQYYGPTIKEHFACIDGGAYYKRAGYGKMFALQFPEMVLFEQENIE